MNRRDLIALLGGTAATWPLAVSAALAKEPPKITILHSGFPNRTPIQLLFEALARLGYENGPVQRRLISSVAKATPIG